MGDRSPEEWYVRSGPRCTSNLISDRGLERNWEQRANMERKGIPHIAWDYDRRRTLAWSEGWSRLQALVEETREGHASSARRDFELHGSGHVHQGAKSAASC